MKHYSLGIIFLIVSKFLVAQSSAVVKFPISVLENPVVNAVWFDSIIPIEFVDSYKPEVLTNNTLLENGYAIPFISNGIDWKKMYYGANPISVSIVFSHYPLKKEDWITNYYELLADRLKELFAIDPFLNTNDINWRLILQTDCKNGYEAESLFHGIAIEFEPIQFRLIKAREPLAFLTVFDYEFIGKESKSLAYSSVAHIVKNENSTSIEEILYPQSIYKRDIEHYKPPKIKRPNDPSCPTFQTRMEKPKRSLWERLFKR